MNINYINGLLLTSLTLTVKGKTLIVDKLVIDTGASHTILSADIVSDLGVFFENGDQIVSAYGIGGEESCYRKKFDQIKLGSFITRNFKIDIGNFHEMININGLIGLDLLMDAQMVIDLKELQMYPAIK